MVSYELIDTARRVLPRRLYLIRRGETERSISGQYSGRADIPLTVHGKDEARTLGLRNRSVAFNHVLTSPLRRASQTCELAGLSQHAEIDTDLVEWDNGDYLAKQAGALSISVRDPEEAKREVEAIIACLSDSQSATKERTQ